VTQRLLRLIAAVAVLLMVPATLTIPVSNAVPRVSSQSQAEDGSTSRYDLQIAAMDPAIPEATSNLRVSALLRNLSEDDLTRITVVLRIGNQALAPQDVKNVSTGVFRPRLPIVRYSDTAPVRSGRDQRFSVELPMAELALPQAGVYPVAVEAIDVALGSIAYTPTVLVWMPPQAWSQSVDLSMMWPILAPPARDAENVITATNVAEQFTADGRLEALLAAAEPFASQVSWAVDPQTLQTAELLASPHKVLTARTVEDQPANRSAATWLSRLTKVLSPDQIDVSAVGYAYPDSPALVASRLSSDVVLASTSAQPLLTEELGRTTGVDLSWAPEGFVDQPTLNVLREAGVEAVVLSDDAVSADTGAGLVRLTAESGRITGIIGNGGLAVANDLAERDQTVRARQQLLAETANAALYDVDSPRISVPPATWAPSTEAAEALLNAATRAPWVRLVPLGSALAAQPVNERPEARLRFGAQPPSTTLNPEQTGLISWGGLVLSIIGQVTTAPSPELENYRLALLRSGSAWWRTDPDAGRVQVERTWAQIQQEQSRLSISTAGTIAFPGEDGRVPITVSNNLDVPVNVGLELRADPDYRLQSEPLEALEIPARQRVSLEVPVRVIGSAPLSVDAQLMTSAGLPYGPSERFDLRTTAYSRVAQWVIWGALAILVLLVARSVTIRITSARADRARDDEDGHDIG